jgi:type VI secretion system protein ImpA
VIKKVMKKKIDIEAILEPLSGENPSGESLRYDPVYDEIQEARRADDQLDRGDWQHEIKTSDWDRVSDLAVTVLTERTKDLQIGAWLLESLATTQGFAGLHVGLQIITGFLQQFWDTVYPVLEDDDLDYRIGPLEFLNDKVWLIIKQIPLTDPQATAGYSWLKWQESRQEDKAEGKISTEDFDRAVGRSSKSFYAILHENIQTCLEDFRLLDEIVDEKFGREAPRLAEFKTALEDCDFLVAKVLKEKREQEPETVVQEELAAVESSSSAEALPSSGTPSLASQVNSVGQVGQAIPLVQVASYRVNRLLGSAGIEEAVWREALAKLETEGIKPALEQLLGASCSAQSMREKTNFRLLTAMLCLKGNRPDLARPIAEELNTLMEELQLSRWESPIWIAEVLDALYQCLTVEGAPDDDIYRSKEILKKICTLDVTKAMGHMG